MNKRLFAIVAFFLIPVCIHAEIERYHRIFEIGVDADVGLSNNYIGIGDILTKNIVIDATDIADNIDSKGLVFDLFAGGKTFVNLNLSRVNVGFFAGLSGEGRFGLGKGLFEFLGYGNDIDEIITFDAKASASVFAEMGTSFSMRIDRFRFRVTPTYFVPVVYLPESSASISFQAKSDGSIRAGKTDGNLGSYTLYSAVSLDENVSDDDKASQFEEALSKNGGFDLKLDFEMALLQSLDVGVTTTIPILPGKLDYSMTQSVIGYAVIDNMLDGLVENQDIDYDSDFDTNDAEYEENVGYKVRRPLRFGLLAAYRPWGNWFSLYPYLGIAAKGIWSDDSTKVFPEYSMKMSLSLFEILGASLFSSYRSQIFAQGIGFMFNTRVIEFDFAIASCSSNFLHSLMLNGLQVSLGARIGF